MGTWPAPAWHTRKQHELRPAAVGGAGAMMRSRLHGHERGKSYPTTRTTIHAALTVKRWWCKRAGVRGARVEGAKEQICLSALQPPKREGKKSEQNGIMEGKVQRPSRRELEGAGTDCRTVSAVV